MPTGCFKDKSNDKAEGEPGSWSRRSVLGALEWRFTPGGFYEILPRTTMADIDDHLGIERRTAEEQTGCGADRIRLTESEQPGRDDEARELQSVRPRRVDSTANRTETAATRR